ncbi:MAG: methyltransferase domain-containing protein [Lachnospiraceae bacterium]|nr:methyltransferase domain-containing protein [Lachnospiraceae bacterium]
MARNPRRIVLDNLIEITENNKPSHIVISASLDLYDGLSVNDRAFVKRMSIGTLEHKLTLDEIINRFSSVPVVKQKPFIRNVLRFGIYQILFTNISDPAACNEAVILCKKYGLGGLSGFVNGVLRNVARKKTELLSQIQENIEPPPDDEKSLSACVKALSFKYSMPEWIVSYFLEHFGFEKTVSSFEYFMKENMTTICCNRSRIEPYVLEQRLKKKTCVVIPVEDAPGCMKISGYDSLFTLDEFASGLFWVQDHSSVLAGSIPDDDTIHEYLNERTRSGSLSDGLDSQSCHDDTLRVLDLCAAPGGKTLNMADRFKVCGLRSHFTACDITERKLKLIRDNIERLRIDNIDVRMNDATVFNPEFEDRFDIVIADVPCSGLGVIGKKPDIKYNMTALKQEELVTLQRGIIENAVRYLHRGGYLVYSTCTVNKHENEDNAAYIKELGFKELLSRQLLPGETGSDGFFYALLKKN